MLHVGLDMVNSLSSVAILRGWYGAFTPIERNALVPGTN